MDVTVVICVSEILGSLYIYRVVPIVLALALFGLAAAWAARRSTQDRSELPEPPAPPAQMAEHPMAKVAALVVVSVVVAEWSTQTVAAYHHGMLSTDTMWYHMPYAARFVQEHSITSLHYFDSEAVTVFFPASSELIHSFGILLMGNDVFSPLINTLWLGIALLASWCIGRPFGVPSITLTGSAILFATPALVVTQPGGAYDDVVGLALILSAVAVLVNSRFLSSERSQRAAWVVAAAAAGLAIGTKWTFVGTVGALTVGVWFLVARERQIRSFAVWLVVLILTGGFWYALKPHRRRESSSPVPLEARSALVAQPAAEDSIFDGRALPVQYRRLAEVLHPGTPSRLWTGLVGSPRFVHFGVGAGGHHRGSSAADPWFGGSRLGRHLLIHSAILDDPRSTRPVRIPGAIRRCSRDHRSRPAADQSGAGDAAESSMGSSGLSGDPRGHPIRCGDLADNHLHATFRRRPRARIRLSQRTSRRSCRAHTRCGAISSQRSVVAPTEPSTRMDRHRTHRDLRGVSASADLSPRSIRQLPWQSGAALGWLVPTRE